MKRERVDQLLVERGLAESRSRAQALVLAGEVFSGERRLDKPGTAIDRSLPLEVRRRNPAWVSRGALKLLHGLNHFALDPTGAVALDVGASTGGFTEVLLARGVARVYAVDVGYGQLHPSLRNDPRVVVKERTNARYLDATVVPEAPSLVVSDASFIALRQVLPAALRLAAPGGHLIALIKPQFEVGKGEVGKGGVVRDPAQHARVCAAVAAWLEDEAGWQVLGVTPSPITGPKGNREFLIAAVKGRAGCGAGSDAAGEVAAVDPKRGAGDEAGSG
ncbi:MAG: TlyA family RNA methyltransferase [Geminicoccaceae bacterium]|nr:MAG: TlyA family RNA methyltransferase [Geminicoccaceae bacterium]